MTSSAPGSEPAEILSRADAGRLLTSPLVDLDLGVLRGVPVLVVDDADQLAREAAVTLADLPLVSVGIAPAGTAPAFDVLVDDVDAVTAVVEGVAVNPMAAVTCCQVLRSSPAPRTLDGIQAGLLLESTAYGTLQAGPEFARWLARRGRRVRPEEPEPPVLVNASGGEVRLILNRPRLRNAWSAAMRDSLVDALRALAIPGDERPIHLIGNGPAFCCGGDPAEFGTVDDPVTGHLVRSSANAAPWLDRLANRLTVTVQGPAVGAGVELAAFAARLRATSGATFRLPEVSMGLLPGAGGTVSIPRQIGRQRAAWLCLTGATIDATRALDWGLVDEISDEPVDAPIGDRTN